MIRPARLSDLSAMVALFEKQHRDMGCSWQIDKTRLAHTFTLAISSPDNWLCLTGDGCLLLATCFESPLGAGKLATELCFCVTPGNLDGLIERYEQWARANGCRAASLSCEQRFGAFERLYRRYGYAPAEMATSKAL